MQAKPIEVIMRIDFSASNGTEIVAHACKVSELVRCKDCKYNSSKGEWVNCNRVVTWWHCPDDYCSRAERKEVDE